MSLQVEKLEKNMAKLTIEVDAQEFEAAVQKAYLKNRSRMSIPGFRKGKAPRQIIEKMYGQSIFFEDAANAIIPEAYEKEVKDCDLEIVSQPTIDVTQIEKGKNFIFTAEVALKPEVTLGDYKGIKVEKSEITVTDEEVDAEIEKTRKQNAREITVEDRAAKNGDTVNIDFDGYMDGQQFEGGKANGFDLVLGSHSFIDTFEEQIEGKNIGDEFDVNVTFPQDYQAAELAGKPAVFKCKLNKITANELPELDDEFAQDVSEFDTLAEYKEDVKKTLTESKENKARAEKEDKVVAAIIENATMDIPQPMIDTQVRQMANEFAQRLQAQGLSFDQYMQFTGMDNARFVEQLKPQALKRIQSRLVLEAVAKAENIESTDADLEEELSNIAKSYNMELDKVKELIGDEEKKQIAEDIKVKKAAKLVTDAAVEE